MTRSGPSRCRATATRPTLPARPKAYVLEMLPYPSGEIHMGHVKNYTMGDVVAHHRRRMGTAVFHPMGYDAFGLPAENAAIRTGEPPAEVTARNIARIREQLKRLGFAIDWNTEIATSDPEYYRWTQWLFLRFLERGLAERREAAVNWCPKDQTVLANEQVVDGRCERCGTEVEQRQLTQWFFRITDYAERLLDDMSELVDWPERVLTMQRNWIGRSEGARVEFRTEDGAATIPVFTTRPDTLFGATFFILAPEHPLVGHLVEGRPQEAAVREYAAAAARASAADRGDDRPAEDRRLHRPPRGQPGQRRGDPGLGGRLRADGLRHRRHHGRARPRRARLRLRHGARPADRAGDRRARAPTADAPLEAAYTGPGRLVNSGFLDGLAVSEAKPAAAAWLAERDLGEATVGYRLRDWLISRQRYWGAPIPIDLLPRAAARCRCPTTSCRCCCPRSTTTRPRAAARWRPTRTSSTRPARRAAARPRARPTRWTPSSTRPGTSCATPRPT